MISQSPPKTLWKNNLFSKVQEIGKNIKGQEDLTPAIQYELNVLDDIWIQGMLQAEWQCHKLHMWPCSWIPEITQNITEIKYLVILTKPSANQHSLCSMACQTTIIPTFTTANDSNQDNKENQGGQIKAQATPRWPKKMSKMAGKPGRHTSPRQRDGPKQTLKAPTPDGRAMLHHTTNQIH